MRSCNNPKQNAQKLSIQPIKIGIPDILPLDIACSSVLPSSIRLGR